MARSYITESTGLITTLATGAVVLNQIFDFGASDVAVSAFVTAAATAFIPFVLRQIHKGRK